MTPAEVLETQFGGPDTGVFTDGSSDPNPGPGGWGWVWVQDGEILAKGHGRDPDTTNNRMELKALIEAFKKLPDETDLVVYSDSQLCVNTINQWAHGWEKRGWKRKGGPIKNLELVQELYTLAQAKPRIELQWIRAHEGTRWNEYADALAALGA
jgi:ribonuclease HI